MAYAHSRNALGERQPLTSHLDATSRLAAQFAQGLGAADVARFLGLWHDLGKFHPQFQQFLLAAEAGHPLPRSPDHKAAGAILARKHLGLLALLLQGHHGGLDKAVALQGWLDNAVRKAAAEEALRLARRAVADLEPAHPLALPAHAQRDKLSAELFLRLLFSALVDADFLDTEAHFFPAKAALRGAMPGMHDLWQRLEQAQATFSGQRQDVVGKARHEIYLHCVRAAEAPPGLFRLTVPTGGGKTRSGLAFALRHAALHGLKRVIFAIPFISITEQTAEEYRRIFETPDGPPVVLEHHSGHIADRGDDDTSWDGLAAENWDAPLIVTTTVQLFQSLFANNPSSMRKLHRLAQSVIVLDEAQALPRHLLTPILDVLRKLAAHYGTTVVFSTATQPAFAAIPAFSDLQATEIVPQPERYFDTLRRVTYDWRTGAALGWHDVAGLMMQEKQVLAVVNTKADALTLLDALGDPHALHLSTLLCGAHRRHVLTEVHRRLANGEPCRLVSTQVVEAGVDLDFPVVLRAMGPLDSIIQAAGRCNREGRLSGPGRVIVFQPQDGGMPFGYYRTAADVAQEFVGRADLQDPDTPAAYFRRLFQSIDTDAQRIQECRTSFDFPETAKLFRMIEDNTEDVIVEYGSDDEKQTIRDNLDALRRGTDNSRLILRQLQPYMVSVYRRQAQTYRRQGWITDISPKLEGLGVWGGSYDPIRGLTCRDLDPSQLVV